MEQVSEKRTFAGGGASRRDPGTVVLFWRLDGATDSPYEAEVMRDSAVVDVRRGWSVDRLKSELTRLYGEVA